MTGETGFVRSRRGFECSFLKPESIANICRWLCYEFIARIALRLIRRVTYGAALFSSSRSRPRGLLEDSVSRASGCNNIDVLIVGEKYLEC